ncbi:GPI inositol-deacylase [Micromonospora foliorum]|uniref:GPI inositol-deacylase n=1 Tax=Micromonospora foliorum TaxID=2911210 RepID=UPI001EE7C4D0|nr:GPI inositol-deacylase [Micromonospora foliorum]MCG5438335.1 GPI inositol-deacylase [Micromonospora foliorum]
MPLIVGVHGIGQQYANAGTMQQAWMPPLRQLLPGSADLACAFYGDLFRPPGRLLGAAPVDVGDVSESGYEAELLRAWWHGASAVDAAVVPPEARTLAQTPGGVQTALRALSNSRFFAAAYRRVPAAFDRLLVADLRQVRRYMLDPDLRREVLSRVEATVAPDTRVVVAHSLGSIVAYEALCAHPEWQVRAFVTLGSPIGVRQLFFDRLRPPPHVDDRGVPRGRWPGSVRDWTNIADAGDVVALAKDLRPTFGPAVRSFLVDNGAHAHDSIRYLTTAEAQRAVADGLTGG